MRLHRNIIYLINRIQLSGFIFVDRQTLVITSTYHLGRDPKLFSNPESFRPERWLRTDTASEPINPFAWLPFGFGPRMCIGQFHSFYYNCFRCSKRGRPFPLCSDSLQSKHGESVLQSFLAVNYFTPSRSHTNQVERYYDERWLLS